MPRGPDPENADVDILQEFALSKDPVLFASEIADAFGKSRQWAHGRLMDLVEDGHLNTKKAGRRSRIYWLSESGKAHLAELRAKS